MALTLSAQSSAHSAKTKYRNRVVTDVAAENLLPGVMERRARARVELRGRARRAAHGQPQIRRARVDRDGQCLRRRADLQRAVVRRVHHAALDPVRERQGVRVRGLHVREADDGVVAWRRVRPREDACGRGEQRGLGALVEELDDGRVVERGVPGVGVCVWVEADAVQDLGGFGVLGLDVSQLQSLCGMV